MKALLIILLAALILAGCNSGKPGTQHSPTINQWQSVIDQGVAQ